MKYKSLIIVLYTLVTSWGLFSQQSENTFASQFAFSKYYIGQYANSFYHNNSYSPYSYGEDKIKIRYQGSEYNYFIKQLSVLTSKLALSKGHHIISPSSIFYNNTYFNSFFLRGPPTMLSHIA